MKKRPTNPDTGLMRDLFQKRGVVCIILPGILFAAATVSCKKTDTFYRSNRHNNENVLRYDVNSPFGSLSPKEIKLGGSTFVLPLLYSYLFVPDENGKLEPDLALNWRYDRTRRTWTIHLRKNVKFHNGKIVSPDDVVYSLNTRLTDSRYARPLNIYKAKALPDDIVQIYLNIDDPDFLFEIWNTEICPRSYGLNPSDDHRPVGSGPFRFKDRKGNREIVLEAYENYYAGRPSVDRIVFRYQPDREKAWTRLLSGDTDIAQEILYKNYQMLYKYENRFYFDRYILRFYTILLYNTFDPDLSDVRVRRALTYAINREYIVNHILKGFGVMANGPMGVNSPFHNPEVKPLPYNPQKSLTILGEAGWFYDKKDRCLHKNGKPFEFTILVFKESQIEKKVARYIQLCLNDIGIRARVNMIGFEDLKSRYFRNTRFQAALTELNGAYRNPEFIKALWSPDSHIKSAAGCFENRNVTQLIHAGLETKDPEIRRNIFYKIDALITSLQPGTFLFQKTVIDAMSKRFQLPHRFSLTNEGIYRLRYAALKHK
jgi:peptide/nickel transport system substrate-binding protein